MNASPSGVLLKLDHESWELTGKKSLTDGLSAVAQIGNTLWLANDETVSLERLALVEDGHTDKTWQGRDHTRFSLGDYLRLPVPPTDAAEVEEIDIEGLAYENGYLWLVGSHSLKRKKPKVKNGIEQAQSQLAKVRREGNRYLLARVPVAEQDGTFVLATEGTWNGQRLTAAQLRGNDQGNDLMDAVSGDPHLGPFLGIPGKDNGFDIEGLAVAGERLFIGLRGPVLRGWAMILEVELAVDSDSPSRLRLKAHGPNERLYRKHFLDLNGLGIRDLSVQGTDLLILAGPTMSLDGTVAIVRWPGGAAVKKESFVPASELERGLEVPHGPGVDRAEGMSLFSPAGGEACSLLVVYDATSDSRRVGDHAVTGDVFPLP